MGSIVSKFLNNKTKKIVILGEEGAGKTTLFRMLNAKYNNNTKRCDTQPGGFNVDVIKDMVVWDLSGKPKFIPFWQCYFNNADGVIWVVDAMSKKNKEVLTMMLSFMAIPELVKAKILVYLNKTDQVEDKRKAELMEQIDLLFSNRPIRIYCTSTKNTRTLFEGYDWLCEAIDASKPRRFYYIPL